MCTLSWVPQPAGYALAMNRDERRARAAGTAPSRRDIAGVLLLAPLDPEAGGSWISVNERGLTLALLNRYEDTPHDSGKAFVSRGLLVLELAAVISPSEAEAALESRSLARYRPFTLVCVGPAPSVRLFEWNGSALRRSAIAVPGLLATSSGVDQHGAERERGALFQAAAADPAGLTPARLAELHRSHVPERGARSVCMHREDAVTVSCALIAVTAEEVRFRQIEGSPCESRQMSVLSLPRAGGATR
jgi:transport and Golgi organization protein 2